MQIKKILPIHSSFTNEAAVMATEPLTVKRKKSKAYCLPLSSRFFPALVSLGGQDLTAIVGTASLASSMGHDGLAALGANRYAGSRQLPVGATALIAAGAGDFTLRDSHG